MEVIVYTVCVFATGLIIGVIIGASVMVRKLIRHL